MPHIRVSQTIKGILDKLKDEGNHTSHDSVIRCLLKNHKLLRPTVPKRVVRTGPCSNGCGKMIEVEEMPGVFTFDFVFCSEECSRAFWERNAKIRAELGLPPLTEVK